jgi:tetratricopeptide (TPR) repeat protein
MSMSMPMSRAAAVVVLSLVPGIAGAQTDLEALWRDPTFQRQFVAGYGVHAEVEPRLKPDEIAILEKIRPFMANLAKAEAALEEELEPDCSATLDFTLARLQLQQDKLVEALASYQKAVTKFPSFARAWKDLGLLHVRNGRHDEAIHAFTRMMQLGGADGYAYGLLGIAYTAKQDYQPAEAAFRNALLLQPDNTEWRLRLSLCVLKQEKFQDAATLLDALIARYPEKGDFWLQQAHAFLGMKQPLRAAENLEMLAELGKPTVDSLHTLGDIYLSESLPELALSAYRRAVDRDPKQPSARPLRAAEALAARGATAQARQLAAHLHTVYDQQMAEPDRRKLLKLEARLSMAEGSDQKETVAVLEEIVRLDPLEGEALLLLGQYHARNNEPDRAMLYFERAAQVEACEGQSKLRHADVLVKLGRYADAIPLLRRAQELKPREDVARYLEQVERAARARR